MSGHGIAGPAAGAVPTSAADVRRAAPADPRSLRPTWAVVDLAAVAHNLGVVRAAAAPSALWAVVKADGYGHGAVPVARTAVAAGAAGLCVALVEEARTLREAGLGAPILVLSEPPARAMEAVAALDLDVAVTSPDGIDRALGAGARRLHLKVDTGMHRIGCTPDDAVTLARRAGPALAAVWTHLAVADEPDDPFTARQLDRFDAVLAALERAGIAVPATHVGNSAGALAHPRARRSFVRTGIALYGLVPGPGVADRCRDLRPALSLHSSVAQVRTVPAGDAISYGLRHRFERAAVVATVPIGYADGVPRRLSAAGDAGAVLIGGRRRPIRGVVTMDQLMVEVGPPGSAEAQGIGPGTDVVLIGEQGGETITADEWASALGTIGYEIVCGIGPRVPRRYLPS